MIPLNGNTLVVILIIEYLIVAAVYGFGKDWPRLTYWVGASIINVAVLTMK